MSIRARYWSYMGKHCFKPCSLSRNNLMCQCNYDRIYERQCLEKPGEETKILKEVNPYAKIVQRIKDAKAKEKGDANP